MTARLTRKFAVVCLFAVAGPVLIGCENNHSKNMQQAEARWARARASVMMQLAQQQYEAGQLDKALVTLGKGIETDPNFARLQVLRGQILAEMGRDQAAAKCFELAIAMDPRSAEARYAMGVQMEKWRQFDKAAACYQDAHDLEPNNIHFVVALAEILGQLNRTGEALELIDRTLAVQEQSVALRVTAGGLCTARGDYEGAVNYYRDAARLANDDSDVTCSLAMAYFHCNQFDKARTLLEQIVQESKSPEAEEDVNVEQPVRTIAMGEVYTTLGDCYLATNQVRQARECFDKVVQLHPDQAGAWENVGKVALHQGRWGDALTAAQRAVAMNPKSPTAYMIRGFALSNQGYVDQALAAFQSAHRLAPRDVLLLCLLADSYRKLGDLGNARSVLVTALKIAPTDPLAGRMMNELAKAQFKDLPGGAAGGTATAGVNVQ
ncbi:MAG: Beta-barrel assembly-enhancing protease [Phycisphaerae bacterium]|nr:Beta-barrel assembly-enhancing protease [Phycisphaerae bacterium]